MLLLQPTKLTFTIALVSRENEDTSFAANNACIPMVITAPFTQRFRIEGPAELVSPLMPLLTMTCPLQYSVEFIRPQVTETDFVWDNFQDQIVIQTRLSKLVVALQALKEHHSDFQTPTAFFPHSLPTVKAPALKLFEYIEKNHGSSGEVAAAAARRPPEKVPESFNGSKKKAESALTPIRPRSPASPLISLPTIPSRPSSSERIPSARPGSRPTSETNSVPAIPSGTTHLPLAHEATADVSNQAEAKAIIMRMRARNSTRAGASSLMPQSSNECSQSQHEDAFPESGLDAKTKAELDEFNHLIVSVKGNVLRDRVSAKNELDYYRQFVPRAPPEGGNISTPRDDPTIRGAPANIPAQSLRGAAGAHNQSLASAATVTTSTAFLSAPVFPGPAKWSKPQTVTRVPGRLPTLTAASPSSDTLTEAESNQELPSMRTSDASKKKLTGSPSQLASAMPSSKKLAPTSLSAAVAGANKNRAKAEVVGEKQSEQQASSKSAGSSSKRTPVYSHHHRPQEQHPQQHVHQQRRQPPELTKKPVQKTPKQLAPTKKARDALSDFDDPDPEVDDAPLLPDDLGGMRAALAVGDDNEDEY